MEIISSGNEVIPIPIQVYLHIPISTPTIDSMFLPFPWDSHGIPIPMVISTIEYCVRPSVTEDCITVYGGLYTAVYLLLVCYAWCTCWQIFSINTVLHWCNVIYVPLIVVGWQWVGPSFFFVMGWVESDGGLGWAGSKKVDPRTTLVQGSI